MNEIVKKLDERFIKEYEHSSLLECYVDVKKDILDSIHTRDTALINAIAEAVETGKIKELPPDEKLPQTIKLTNEIIRAKNQGIDKAVEIIRSFAGKEAQDKKEVSNGKEAV